MPPSSTHEAGLPPSPLTTPVIAEQVRIELGKALESYLAPIVEHCDRQEANEDLTTADFKLVYAIRECIAALFRYDDHTEVLLARYRDALAFAQQQPAAEAPSLEYAILCQLSPADLLAHRQADPVYRLGYARGYEKAKQQYEHLGSLYAQHATLPTSPSYVPAPLVARISQHLATPGAQTIANLSPEARQALNNLNDLPTNGPQ
jgi:hypothetical protein